jgi:hypothetical protein
MGVFSDNDIEISSVAVIALVAFVGIVFAMVAMAWHEHQRRLGLLELLQECANDRDLLVPEKRPGHIAQAPAGEPMY